MARKDPQQTMASAAGCPVADNQNTIAASPHGPILMQDVHPFFEKMAHFNRERVVHAKGAGAYGKFTVSNDVSKYTCARLLGKVGNECETFLHFLTVAGELGSAETVRDTRGFAVKLCTEQGNWDMVGNMRFDDNGGSSLTHEPNHFGGPTPPLRISDDADRHDHRKDNDGYSQAGIKAV